VTAVLLHVFVVDVVTSTQTSVVSVILPEVPVIVNSYTPSVVAGEEVVVVAVTVPVSAPVLLIVTEVEVSVHLGSVAFDSEVVTAQLSVTVPVNELTGDTVIVAVSFVVAPGATVRLAGDGESVKPAAAQLVQGGACQKLPQPDSKQASTGVAANRIRAQLPILIAAPMPRYQAAPSSISCLQVIARMRTVSCLHRSLANQGASKLAASPHRQTPALCHVGRSPAKIRLSFSPSPRLIKS
jgi:hypothetical protein